MLPRIEIAQLDKIFIARDDLIAGGTKRRALHKYLHQLKSDHFIYAGSVYGSGGWALAEACRDLRYGCTLVLAKSPYRPAWIDQIDCMIEWRETEPVEQIYQSLQDRKTLLPLGFDDPLFISCLADVFSQTDVKPSEIWIPCVSGVLVRAAQKAWPDIQLNAVCTAKHHGDLGRAKKYQALEKYHQAAKSPPPYPANAFSDAKLWSFVTQFALKDALVWNTSA